MRVSPVGWALDDIEHVLAEAEASAAVTHNHPEGIKGAQATAAGIFLARSGKGKDDIKSFISDTFNYDLDRKIDEIRDDYFCDLSCQKTVPEAFLCFLESTDYESCIRLAVSLGGDADTMACIAGSVAEAFYGDIPEAILNPCLECLDERLQEKAAAFYNQYMKR